MIMTEFWQALGDPDIGFLRLALVTGLLASVAFGMTGMLVVVKRISYVAGAIAHAVLGGIGAALYLQRVHGLAWLEPIWGALAAALLAAVLMAWIRGLELEREDSVIGAIWATGMAAGLVFLFETPGYVDPLSYLFGNILILSERDLWLVVVLDIVLLAVVVFWYTRLQALCFDEEFARLRGMHSGMGYLLLLCLIGCTVVLLVSVVGVILVVALLTIPAAMASHWVRSLAMGMVVATGITMVLVTGGLAIGYEADWPAGPSIILLAGLVYLVHSAVRRLPWSRLAGQKR